jgi:hypothetical protein
MALARRTLAAVAVAGLLGLGGGVAASSASAAPAGKTAAADSAQAPGDLWKRTELFFGTGKPDGSEVSDQEFAAFSDAEITPAFPDGFTRLDGNGQWRGDSGAIVREHSHVIIVLYPFSDTSANRRIEKLRVDYKLKFQQESVLRTDTVEKVSF